MRSSSEFSTCRLDWRPSRLLAAALIALGVLAALSLWLSALPRALALAGVAVALGRGFQLARREWRQPTIAVLWRAADGSAELNFAGRTQSLTGVQVDFRGPLARLSGRDEHGRIRRWQWWPDTLPPAVRRSLRVAAQFQAASSAQLPPSAA